MNILYIAFSCSPYHGSEDKIGWNVPLESAKINNVFVITREDQRQYVERYLREHPEVKIRFYYVDIRQKFRKLLAKAPYTPKLNLLHRTAYRVAKQICQEEKIDLIHQITPVEFRSIGNYSKIPNVKFVCGPLGGGEYIPKGLRSYGVKKLHLEAARFFLNWYYKMKHTLSRTLRNCVALYANYETSDFLSSKNMDSGSVFSEIGISEQDIRDRQETETARKMRMLVVGRLVYRKGHALLLDALERLPDGVDYECWIVGGGEEHAAIRQRCQTNPRLSKHVSILGSLPYERVMQMYGLADVCIVPSIRETTGSVILEAMSYGIPIITINRFGGATILDSNSGWLYEGNTKEEYIENLKNAIINCIENPEEVKRRGENAKERAKQYTWSEHCKYYQSIYDQCLSTEESYGPFDHCSDI